MKSRFISFCCLSFLLLTAGCTSNSLIIASQQNTLQQQNTNQLATRKAGLACILTDDQRVKYSTLVLVLMAPNQPIPQKAKDARIDGCAGVEFQLDKDGKAIHLNMMNESPAGYGFADALQQRVTMEKYKPSMFADQWYYVTTTYVTSTMITPKPDNK